VAGSRGGLAQKGNFKATGAVQPHLEHLPHIFISAPNI
jgi:hypothetical protein